MGSRKMQGGEGGGGPHRIDSHIQNLARQGSLYSLTLNEVQSQLGEPLLSMNFDELLKSIFPEGTAESESPPRPVMATGLRPGPSNGFDSGLQRQGSITMPPALSNKTVDEVWRGISGLEDNKTGDDQLGGMTLESFLIKAGVVLEGPGKDVNTGNLTGSSATVTVAQQQPRGMQWFGSGLGSYMPGQMGPSVSVGGMGPGTVIDAMYPGGGRRDEVATPGRKRTGGSGSGPGSASGEIVDKTMERRQKRMIKNRESAARSRARKQAYTNELENKVSRLEEENERFKKQKVLDKILCAGPPPAPKYQLRRTSSASF
ncbi:ABSCISIC ACID-INSENSITIVE 5-like protein 3 isoform X2 [Carex rostrata]